MPKKTQNPELAEFETHVKGAVALGLRSKAATLERLIPAIDRMSELGYPQETMLEIFAKHGMEFTLGSFRNALFRIKQKTESK